MRIILDKKIYILICYNTDITKEIKVFQSECFEPLKFCNIIFKCDFDK